VRPGPGQIPSASRRRSDGPAGGACPTRWVRAVIRLVSRTTAAQFGVQVVEEALMVAGHQGPGVRQHDRVLICLQACGRFTGTNAQPVIDLVSGIFANDQTPVLAYQRIAGNAHELDALIAGRKQVRASIEAFVVVPDAFDYAETGQTVAGIWDDGDDTARRGMAYSGGRS
jgi:hypothetical protein